MSKLVLCVCSNPTTGISYLSDKHIIESIMGTNLNYYFLSGNDEGNSFPNMPDMKFECVWFAGCNISSNLFSYNISEIIKRVQILANHLNSNGFVIFTEASGFKSSTNFSQIRHLQKASKYTNITIEELITLNNPVQDNIITPDEILCSNLYLYSLSKIWNYYFNEYEITDKKLIIYKQNIKQREYVDSLRTTIIGSLSGGYRKKQTKKTIRKLKH